MLKFSHFKHFVFTEQGIAMLSTVLRSEEAIKTSIRIMEVFVKRCGYEERIGEYVGLISQTLLFVNFSPPNEI
jgi:hypothetical protein